MLRLRVEAQCQRLNEVIDFVNAQLEKWDCPMKTMTLIDVCVEEIFVNIAHYAYPQGGGWAEIYCQAGPGRAEIQLEDEGIAFNPLDKADPDVTLDAQARQNRRTGHLYGKAIHGSGFILAPRWAESIDHGQALVASHNERRKLLYRRFCHAPLRHIMVQRRGKERGVESHRNYGPV